MTRFLALIALLFAVPTVALAQSEGAVTPGNVAPRSALMGCLYNSSPPTAVNNQQQAVQCSANGGMVATATSVVTSPYVTPTITAGAYNTGDVLGGIMSFTSQPTTGAIANANVTFNSGSFSAGTVDLYLFNASPTGGGTTDHAAFALTSTDTAKMIGVLHLSDCTSLGGVLAQCQSLYQSQFYTLAAAGTTVYAVAVVRGTPTFAATTAATFSLNILR